MAEQAKTRVMLLTGIPASGKSVFGQWLEKSKGFLFLNVEHGALDRLGLKAAWDGMFSGTGTAEQFVQELTRLQRLVVLDWGFPVHCLPIVEALQQAGVEAWWFDGNREAARQSFVRRGTVPIELFDKQLSGIEREWAAIQRTFRGHILKSIRSGPAYPRPQTLFARLSR